MPSKLDPYLPTIENWLAGEPQITALAIVRRLAAIDPLTFSDKQHSIVQRLVRSFRQTVAETVTASMPIHPMTTPEIRPGAVDGAACDDHSAPPTAPPASWFAPETRLVPSPQAFNPGNIPS